MYIVLCVCKQVVSFDVTLVCNLRCSQTNRLDTVLKARLLDKHYVGGARITAEEYLDASETKQIIK